MMRRLHARRRASRVATESRPTRRFKRQLVHETLEFRRVLATGMVPRVDLAAFSACDADGLVQRVAAPAVESVTENPVASGTVEIDPNEPGEPGTGTNLGKPDGSPFGTPVSNGVTGGEGPGAGQNGNPDGDQPPTVAFTSPPDGTRLVDGGMLTFLVDATDDVAILRVEFYRDGSLLNLDSTVPYQRDLPVPSAPGSYVFEALAIDSAGQTSSDRVTIHTGPEEPPPPNVADLSVQIAESSDPVAAGSLLSYTVDVFNHGPDSADNVVVTLAMPPDTTFASSSATTGTFAASTGRWIIGALDPGQGTLTLEVLVDAAAQGKVIRALPLVTSTTEDPDPFNDIAMINTPVTAAMPPGDLVLESPPIEVDEGETFAITGTFDASDAPHTATVSWGDGTSSSETLAAGVNTFTLTHAYDDDAPTGTPADDYEIAVTVSGGATGGLSASHSIRVNNVAPTITSLDVNPPNFLEGGIAQLLGTFSDPGLLDTYTLHVDWDGDGVFDNALPVSGGQFEFARPYPDDPAGPDSFHIGVELVDDDGGAMTAGAPITVANDPPFVSSSPDETLPPGELAFSRSISFTDRGEDAPWTVTVDWGDGTPVETFTTETRTFPISHTYGDIGESTVTVSVDDGDGNVGIGAGSFVVTRTAATAAPAIAGVHLFYNGSSFDNNGPDVTADDNAALATDKQPTHFGETGTFASVSSFPQGITGVFVDIVDLPDGGAGLSAADFTTSVGIVDDVSAWSAGPAPSAVGVIEGGVPGADRVYLAFDAGAIVATWVRITIGATAATGLTEPQDVFFASIPGDTGASFPGNPTSVDAADSQFVSQNVTPLEQAGTEPIDEPADINRDGTVSAFDLQIVTMHAFTTVPLITPTAPPPAAAAAAAKRPAEADSKDAIQPAEELQVQKNVETAFPSSNATDEAFESLGRIPTSPLGLHQWNAY